MDKFGGIENEIRAIGTEHQAISSLVRGRLDETYAALTRQPQQSIRSKGTRRLRQLMLSTAAAGLIGFGVLGAGFVSPVMAGALKNIPVVGSLFSSIQTDIGLRTAGVLGLTSQAGSAAAYEDVKLEVSESFYDGTRAAFLLHVAAPNLKNGIYDNGKKDLKLSSAVENVFFKVDGGAEGGGLYFGGAGEVSPDTLVFEQVMAPGTAPDSFKGTVTMKLDGIDHEFVLEIPFQKTAIGSMGAKDTLAVSAGDLTLAVSNVSVTPVSTRLTTSVALNGAKTLTEAQERRLIKVGIAVYDDQGRRLPALNGDGVIQGNRLVFDRRYATTPGNTAFLTVKPFLIRDDFAEDVKEDQFLKGLETRIELTPAP